MKIVAAHVEGGVFHFDHCLYQWVTNTDVLTTRMRARKISTAVTDKSLSRSLSSTPSRFKSYARSRLILLYTGMLGK